ncbi:MAG TPA: hypothetical protein DEP18_00480 [Flavobacteriales bacterium]|nr:hypothetical protein [Flavobacteriales bacterium]HCA82233.1 hypothetical protein [Flavobacteriales bacterium]HRE74040.1 hypothetical protein [Flavobacteriales bacterium]HRJ35631.1 hypothetical protein [Flavobacteriales bacterium]HRJ38282.1 hypothetical protein [Flavobacteriales bacterium]
MKTFFLSLFCFLLFSFSVAAQTQGEVVILRVEYAKKSSGIEHRMQLDAGISTQHSLSGKVINEKGVVRIKTDEKTESFTNEVDLLSYLQKNGFRLLQVFNQTIMGETYLVYLLERP